MEWKPIPGYDGYFAHPDGLIMNSVGRILKGTAHQGYRRVCIGPDESKQLIHRLIALTFLPNPEQKSSVDHINLDKSDNRLENLRWATHMENGNNKPAKKCIYWSSRNKGWQAQKTIFGRTHHSKYFKTAQEAEDWLRTL